jgi:hypothetical protein
VWVWVVAYINPTTASLQRRALTVGRLSQPGPWPTSHGLHICQQPSFDFHHVVCGYVPIQIGHIYVFPPPPPTCFVFNISMSHINIKRPTATHQAHPSVVIYFGLIIWNGTQEAVDDTITTTMLHKQHDAA